jgi:hypothetical protein
MCPSAKVLGYRGLPRFCHCSESSPGGLWVACSPVFVFFFLPLPLYPSSPGVDLWEAPVLR